MSFKHLYSLLIEPAPTITSKSERRRVRALSVLTISLLLLTLGGLFFGAPLYITLFAMATGYGLTRTAYYRIGALVILFGIYNSSFTMLSNPASTLVSLTNSYLVLFVGIIFGGAWLSTTGSFLNMLFLLVNLLAVSWVNPGLSANGPAPLIMIESLVFTLGALVTLTNGLSRMDQRELDAQYAEITSQAELLTQKNAGLERARQEGILRNIELAEARDMAMRSNNELHKYFQAIEQGGTAIMITDAAGKIEYVNPSFEALTGYSQAEAVGQNPRILKSGLQPPEFYEQMWKTICAGQIWHGELHNKRKDGSLFWEAGTIAPIQNQDNQITNYVSIKENITADRELQQKLKRQNTFLSILHQTTLDLLNHQNLEDLLNAVVERACIILDAPLGEIMLKEGEFMVVRAFTKNQPYLIGDKVDRSQAKLTWQAHDTGQPVVLEDYLKWSGHRDIYEQNPLHAVADFPVMARQECIGVLAMGRTTENYPFSAEQIEMGLLFAQLAALVLDNANLYNSALKEIEQRKRTEQQLAIARDQALEASRFKSQLLAKVSHELRTPLGSAIGYAELLQNNILGPVSDEQKQALGNIIDSGNYLNLMINELLDQAQIESKSVRLRITPFSPSELLSHLMSIVNVLATNKNLSCGCSLAPDLPEILYGDPKRIQQIVINLTGNAIKFTTVGEVRVDILYPDPEHWALRVSDTGSGIAPEAQTYIFEPFRQTDSAITSHNRGIGLGLSITKQLVELMDGQIMLESEIDKGSIFTVILPIIRQPES